MSRRTRATSRKDLGTSRKTLEIEERAREASPLVQEFGRKLARTSRELYDLCCKTLPCCGIIRRARFGPSQASCPGAGVLRQASAATPLVDRIRWRVVWVSREKSANMQQAIRVLRQKG